MYRKIYLFDVLNPNEILKGEKPMLKERGPYTYRVELNEKISFKTILNNTSIIKSSVKTYYFESNLSNGNNESDLITFLNVPALVCRILYTYIYVCNAFLF
jgi:hypothetical protein